MTAVADPVYREALDTRAGFAAADLGPLVRACEPDVPFAADPYTAEFPVLSLDEEQRHASALIKELRPLEERAGAGVFRDYCELAALTFETLDTEIIEAGTARRAGRPYVSPLGQTDLYRRLLDTYGPEGMAVMGRAFGSHSLATGEGYVDVLGAAYMEIASRVKAKWLGQFFTPMNLCVMMARMSVASAPELRLRLAEAGARSQDLDATFAVNEGVGLGRFWRLVVPRVDWEAYRPIRVLDPAVGSGRFLLAAAAAYPRWAVQFGLVQFYGQDIDPLCIAMCRANVAAYGLNGFGARMMALTGTLPSDSDVGADDPSGFAERADRLLNLLRAVERHASSAIETSPEPRADARGQLLLF